jgi:hypothetical protein
VQDKPGESFGQNRLDKNVLIVEKEHLRGRWRLSDVNTLSSFVLWEAGYQVVVGLVSDVAEQGGCDVNLWVLGGRNQPRHVRAVKIGTPPPQRLIDKKKFPTSRLAAQFELEIFQS